jgi:hypothetical protein
MAAKYNIKIEQGATYLMPQITWKDSTGAPINLTGYTAMMHIRGKIDDTDTLYELTTENGRIVLGGVLGTVDINIPATDTTNFTWSSAVFDLELISGSFVKRFLQGSVSVSKEVTR